MAKLGLPGKKQRYFEFLIDSGADFSIIANSDAEYLGISYKDIKSEETNVEVANLTFIKTKKVTMKLTIENISLNIPVLVANQEVECLLGRECVFHSFDVLIQQLDKQVVFIKR